MRYKLHEVDFKTFFIYALYFKFIIIYDFEHTKKEFFCPEKKGIQINNLYLTR